MKKIKRIDHVFQYSIAAIAVAGSIAYYTYEESGAMLVPALFALGAVISGFVMALDSVQGKRKSIYRIFVAQMVFLCLTLVSFGIVTVLLPGK